MSFAAIEETAASLVDAVAVVAAVIVDLEARSLLKARKRGSLGDGGGAEGRGGTARLYSEVNIEVWFCLVERSLFWL